ncbi:hypothetical protein GCM10028824_36640 [Hymenobacter segetis]|uniref:T9SS type A sorting domain-containing protein n=1 Tax=Hymenobacter segetis TaxID=2025509 RepID=A0ABU9LXC0_9BACT
MKTALHSTLAALALGLGAFGTASAQTGLNLVPNGSFESRNHEPQGQRNIAPNSDYDDLSNWFNVSNTPDYLTSTTPVLSSNTQYNTDETNPDGTPHQYAPFFPRSGTGCASIVCDPPGVSTSEFIGQHLTGLLASHVYQADFYVLRRPTTTSKSKVSLTVHSAMPTRNYAVGTILAPTPYASITSADYITDTHNWTHVTGTFVAQTTDAWIAIGFEGSPMVSDNSLEFVRYYPYGGSGPVQYVIDDVSIVDQGCPPTSGNGGTLDLATDFGPMADPQNPGSINNYDDYCYSQTFTFTVPEAFSRYATGFQWSVSGYDVTNTSEVRNYTENGGTMSFTPVSTYPYIYRNVNVTCNISYGSCPAGACYRSLTIASQDEDGNQCVMYRAAPTQEPIAIYPNPATERIMLSQKVEQAELLNGSGKVVVQQFGASTKQGLDVHSLPNGLYMLRIIQQGKVSTQRIQISH